MVMMKIFSFIRDREMKVAARNEALQQAAEELQKKIEQKVGVLLHASFIIHPKSGSR